MAGEPTLGKRNFVKDGDLRILTMVGILAMSVLIIFGAAVYWSGILDFPAMPQDTETRDYVNDSLIYRERRMALALVMRTFLTGFSFVVGLALCTMGGLFILRQVSSLTSLSGNLGGGMGLLAEDAAPKEVADRLQKTQFSFASYSPGVMFMVGGVAIMVVTQFLAIPVRAVEIVPTGAAALCVDPETGNHGSCGSGPPQSFTLPGDDQGADAAAAGIEFDLEALNAISTAAGGPDTVTSEAVLEQAPDETEVSVDHVATPIGTFFTLEQIAAVELADGYRITGVRPTEILVEGNGKSMTFAAWDLDFNAPDWGIRFE